MSRPARSGVLVYARDLARMARFYSAVLGAREVYADGDHRVLVSPDTQIILHAIRPAIAATIVIQAPPLPREDQAIGATRPRVHGAVTVTEDQRLARSGAMSTRAHTPLAQVPRRDWELGRVAPRIQESGRVDRAPARSHKPEACVRIRARAAARGPLSTPARHQRGAALTGRWLGWRLQLENCHAAVSLDLCLACQ